MDHSNLAGEKYSNGQCAHGMCLEHGPEWGNVGEKHLEPNPGIFGTKTYWFARCCGSPMAKYRAVQTQRCRKCGRTEDLVTHYYVALCICCGRTKDMTPDPGF